MFVVLTLLALCLEAQKIPRAKENGALLEVAFFVVQFEVEASHLNGRKDLCVAIDTRAKIREMDLVARVKSNGLLVHPQDWCNQGPRGFRILVGLPVQQSAGVYEMSIEVADLTIKPGEHFATVLKQGIYRVKLEKESEPELVSYQKTCCPRTE